MGRFLIALLLVVTIPTLLAGCQRSLEEGDKLSSPINSPAGMSKSENKGIDNKEAKSDLINEEVVSMQEELDSFTEDMEDLENFGGDAVVSEIDRELDGF